MELEGKVALVTGGARGIGAVIAVIGGVTFIVLVARALLGRR